MEHLHNYLKTKSLKKFHIFRKKRNGSTVIEPFLIEYKRLITLRSIRGQKSQSSDRHDNLP